MTKKYVEFPKTILSLATELKKICDDYFNKTIALKELEELLLFYKTNNATKEEIDIIKLWMDLISEKYY